MTRQKITDAGEAAEAARKVADEERTKLYYLIDTIVRFEEKNEETMGRSDLEEIIAAYQRARQATVAFSEAVTRLVAAMEEGGVIPKLTNTERKAAEF